MSRLSSGFWVSAYIKTAMASGDFCALRRRGANEGGAIFVVIDHTDGYADLYAPLPQALMHDLSGERVFERALERASLQKLNERLEREQSFDSDLWIIERESRVGRHDLPIQEQQ